MLGYFTFVALLNLGLGYALAVYLHTGGRPNLRQLAADLKRSRTDDADAPAELAETAAQTAAPQPAVEPAKSSAFETPSEVSMPAAPVAATAETPTPATIPNTGLVTLDYVDQLLSEVTTANAAAGTPTSIILMELDSIEGGNDVAQDRVIAGIAETVHGLLDETHTAARFADQRFFLLLPGDNESQATQRAEQVRQQIEATEFLANDRRVHATVTCALAEMSSDSPTAEVLEALEAALAKGKRLGGNRTYMFDGIAPSPVVPPELNLASQKCAI